MSSLSARAAGVGMPSTAAPARPGGPRRKAEGADGYPLPVRRSGLEL